MDFLCSLPEYDEETIGVTEGSQGGALSIVTAALDSRIKFLALMYPALCDHTGPLNHRAGGWPQYFQYKKPLPNEVEMLAYFDVVNLSVGEGKILLQMEGAEIYFKSVELMPMK